MKRDKNLMSDEEIEKMELDNIKWNARAITDALCNIFYYDDASLDDLKTLAYTDITGIPQCLADEAEKVLYYNLEKYGEEWDSKDPDFENSTFYSGYILDGEVFATNYSGVAGRYWDSICCYNWM